MSRQKLSKIIINGIAFRIPGAFITKSNLIRISDKRFIGLDCRIEYVNDANGDSGVLREAEDCVKVDNGTSFEVLLNDT